jgi:4-amino-4-deoxy-L-arabinose transferase-like glycosyltransferase
MAVALVLRVLSVGLNNERMGWQNESLFAIPAMRLLEGKGLTLEDGRGPTAYRPPLYVFWLAGNYAIFGDRATFGPSLMQGLVSTLNVLLVYLLTRRLWRKEAPALIAAGLMAVHPYALWHDPAISYTFLATSVGLAAAYALVRLVETPKPRWAFFAGALLGLCVLLTATVAPAIALLFVAGIIGWRVPMRQRVVLLALVAAGIACTWGPWIVRNAIAFRAFVPLTTEAGLTLWYGNNPEASWRVPIKAHEDSPFPTGIRLAYPNRINDCVRREHCLDGATEVQENQTLARHAVAWITENPTAFATLTAWRLSRLWSPFLSPAKAVIGHPFIDAMISWGYAGWTLMLYASAAIGATALWRRGQKTITVALFTVIVVAPSLYALFLYFTRYRIPFEMILLAFSGGGIWTAIQATKRFRAPQAQSPATISTPPTDDRGR